MRIRFAAIGGLALLAGCTFASDMKLAQAAIADFHSKLNAGQFDAIYDAASPDLKAATSRADHDRVLAAIHDKLGAFQRGSTWNFNDRVKSSGHFMTIGYSATYAAGRENETFVFRIDGNTARLAGWHFSPPAPLAN